MSGFNFHWTPPWNFLEEVTGLSLSSKSFHDTDVGRRVWNVISKKIIIWQIRVLEDVISEFFVTRLQIRIMF
jgi:hypothetical protein